MFPPKSKPAGSISFWLLALVLTTVDTMASQFKSRFINIKLTPKALGQQVFWGPSYSSLIS